MLSVYYIQLSNSLSSSPLRLPLPNAYVVACVSAPAAFAQTPTPLSVQPPVTTAGPVRSAPKSYIVTSPPPPPPPSPKSYIATCASCLRPKSYTSFVVASVIALHQNPTPPPSSQSSSSSTGNQTPTPSSQRGRATPSHQNPTFCLLPVSICKYFAKTCFKLFFAKCIC